MYELINDAYKPSSPCLCFLFLIRPFTKNTFPRRNRSRWQKVSTVSLDSNNYKCRCHQWVTCVFCHLSFKQTPLCNLFVFHSILILLSKNRNVYIMNWKQRNHTARYFKSVWNRSKLTMFGKNVNIDRLLIALARG